MGYDVQGKKWHLKSMIENMFYFSMVVKTCHQGVFDIKNNILLI